MSEEQTPFIYDFATYAQQRDAHLISQTAQLPTSSSICYTHLSIREEFYSPNITGSDPVTFYSIFAHTHSAYSIEIARITLKHHGHLQTAKAIYFPNPYDQTSFIDLPIENYEGPHSEGSDNLITALACLLTTLELCIDVTISTFLLDGKANLVDKQSTSISFPEELTTNQTSI
jgi:hypothetical protein